MKLINERKVIDLNITGDLDAIIEEAKARLRKKQKLFLICCGGFELKYEKKIQDLIYKEERNGHEKGKAE